MNLIPPPREEQRFLLHNISWQMYENLLKELGNRPIRLTYDRGNLELMSPSYEHEAYGALLGRMIEILTEELNIPIKAGKSTTFRRLDLDRGLEPDECYYIDNAARLLGKAEIDLRRDPPPDLAIEVDITSSSLDRMGVYAALGVPELWRFDGQSLQVYRLGPKGAYEPVDRSPNFPSLPPAEVVGFLHQSLTTDDTSLARSFRAWVRERIVPTWKGSRGAAPD